MLFILHTCRRGGRSYGAGRRGNTTPEDPSSKTETPVRSEIWERYNYSVSEHSIRFIKTYYSRIVFIEIIVYPQTISNYTKNIMAAFAIGNVIF